MRQRINVAMALLAAAVCVPWAAKALYEDQAGKLDFHIENVGRVNRAEFDGDKLFVGTDSSVVALLDATSGSLSWRRVLPPQDAVDVILPLQRYLLTLSGGGRHVHLWNGADGALVWDTVLPAAPAETAAAPIAAAFGGGAEAYLLAGGAIHVVHWGKGTLLETFAPNPATDAELAVLVGADTTIIVTDVRPHPEGGGAVAAGLASRKGRVEYLLYFDLRQTPPGGTAAADAKQPTVVFRAARVGRGGADASQGATLLGKPGGDDGFVVTALAADGKSLLILDPATAAAGAAAAAVEVDVATPLGGYAAVAARTMPGSGGVLLALTAEPDAGAETQPAKAALALAPRTTGGGGGSTPWELVAAAHCFTASECVLTAAKGPDGRVIAASVSRATNGKLAIVARDAATPATPPRTAPFALDLAERGELQAVFLHPDVAAVAIGGGSSPSALSLLAVSADDSAVMFEAPRQLWAREEALARIESVDFVDLAADELSMLARQGAGGGDNTSGGSAGVPAVAVPAAGQEHHIPDFQERLRLQWLELRALLARAVSAATGAPMPAELAALAQRDSALAFGFKKLAVCATASGKLLALRMEDGGVSWAAMAARYGGSGGAQRVFVTRPKAVLGYMPEFVLVQAAASGGKGALTWYDGLTGERKDSPAPAVASSKAAAVASVVPLDIYDSEDRQVLMVVHSDRTVSLAPSSPEAEAAFTKLLPNVFFHELSPSAGLISYAIIAANAATGNSGDGGATGGHPTYRSVKVATAAFPPDSTVAAVAYPNRRDVIQSPAHVLGDESLLLKYLNPHLVAVVLLGPPIAPVTAGTTVAAAAAAAAAAGGGGIGAAAAAEGSELTLLLLDTVSARVLQRISHQGAAGPVHAAVLENRVVYTYWNARARRTEVGSVSLFEGVIERRALNPLSKPEYKENFSAFEAHAPVTVHRTYTFPHAVSALGTTLTQQGIAAKHLLVGFGAGQLLSLDPVILDARRPLSEPTTAEKAERLVQYHPFVPVIRQQVVSHTLAVERLRAVHCAAAALESTSLVLATGLDVFGTRVAPSRTFDLLSPDFNAAMLLLVLAGMATFIVVASAIVRKKELSARWA
ncbi:unnamed protein product [Phaeothamnion confervicola]